MLFFRAGDGSTGNELWRSDGTAGGTILVKDIVPGSAGSNPDDLTNVNGMLFFRATDTDTYTKLWRSDGVADGTHVVKDIQPSNLIGVNGILLFSVSYGTAGVPPTQGAEIWKSDGSPAGTRPVKDVGSGFVSNFTDVSGRLFFTMSGMSIRYRLWTSDGSAFGTIPVPVQLPGSPINLVDVQGSLFFSVGDYQGYGLWRSDGTLEGTSPVKSHTAAQGSALLEQFTPVRGRLLLTQKLDQRGVQLWRSDGDETTTVPVKLFPATLSDLTELNGMLFFATDDGTGIKLWRNDGSEPGTTSIKTISASQLTKVDRSLFFGGRNERGEIGLWKSNGTPEGTVPVKALVCDTDSTSCRVDIASADTRQGVLCRR